MRIFSATGGIEKVSKVAGKAMYEFCTESGGEVQIFSMYDQPDDIDARYFPGNIFTGFAIKKLRFVLHSVANGRKCDVVILSHVNLLTAGYLIKFFSPKTKLILVAHGIEVWKKFRSWKKNILLRCDHILAVSEFTKNTLVRLNQIPRERISVINNCLDPYLQKPVYGSKNVILQKKYGLKNNDKVLMTLTRLDANERYKGYDQVIKSLDTLRDKLPELKYLIIGKYDTIEKQRLDKLIELCNLKDKVIFAGFIPDDEIADHYNLTDFYIMPSYGEGFGIVFIEAMYYHKPVIAGNADGSSDALLNGRLGILVNPHSEEDITNAIEKVSLNKEQYLPDQELLMDHFSFQIYKEKWHKVLQQA